jgi:hypothetical protein
MGTGEMVAGHYAKRGMMKQQSLKIGRMRRTEAPHGEEKARKYKREIQFLRLQLGGLKV